MDSAEGISPIRSVNKFVFPPVERGGSYKGPPAKLNKQPECRLSIRVDALGS